jgi:selenide,water dikinase
MVRPGRTADVIAFLNEYVDWGPAGSTWKGILADPQTSGGLLMAVAPEKAEVLIAALEVRGEEAVIVGRMVAGEAGTIRIV